MKRKELVGLCLAIGTCLALCGCGSVSEEEQAKRDEAAKYEHTLKIPDSQGGSQGDNQGQGSDSQGGSQGDNQGQGSDSQGGSQGDNQGQGSDSQGGSQGDNQGQGSDSQGGSQGDNQQGQGSDSQGGSQGDNQQGQGSDNQGGQSTDVEKEEPVTFKAVNDHIKIIANALRLRMAPSLESEVYKMSYNGEIYKRTGIGSNGFDRLEADGITVYAAAQYLEFYDPTAIKYPELYTVDAADALYSYDDMQEDINAIKETFGDIVTVNEMAVTADGRKVQEIVIGSADAPKHILITAGINGRDYVTSQLLLAQIENFLNNYYTATLDGLSYEGYIKKVAVHFVPMVNPDGIAISQEGLEGIDLGMLRENIKAFYENNFKEGYTEASFEDYLLKWKANANGVDLNRNFSVGFDDYYGIGVAGAEKYKGDMAMSQPETEALAALVENIMPIAVVNYHTSGDIIYWNYEQAEDVQEESKALAYALAETTMGYAVDDWSSVEAATFSDWTAVAKGIPTVDIEVGTGASKLSTEEFTDLKNKHADVIISLLYRYK